MADESSLFSGSLLSGSLLSGVEVVDAAGSGSPAPSRDVYAPQQLSTTVLGGLGLKQVIENYLSYYASGTGHTARAKRYDLEHFYAFLETAEMSRADQCACQQMSNSGSYTDARYVAHLLRTADPRSLAR